MRHVNDKRVDDIPVCHHSHPIPFPLLHAHTHSPAHIAFETHACLTVPATRRLRINNSRGWGFTCRWPRLRTHKHTQTHRQRCSLIDSSLPQNWAGPVLTSSLDPEGFTKVKGQSGRIVPPVADCSAWKTGPMLTLLFSNKQHLTKGKACLLDWTCPLHVPISNFSHERCPAERDFETAQFSFFFFVLLWNNQESEPDREKEGAYPLLSPCPAGSSAVWAMRRRRRRRPWECEVPLAVPGPTMSWLCGMWDMHSLLCGGAE